MLKPKKWSINWGGRPLSVEVGKLALQTTASCTVQYGETVVLATVVKSNSIREGIDYFPLTVDFEEKFYAAGKIKGSRFIKREGRPSDEAILAGRVIDRSIRPLFDDNIRNDVQLVITALSIDGENDASIIGLIAASTVLSLSSIAWEGPIGAARIGIKENGEFILNITRSELEQLNTLDLIVAGTPEKLIMVEAGAQEIDEQTMYNAMKWGCEQMAPVIDFISTIQKEAGLPKELPEAANPDNELYKANQQAENFVAENADRLIFSTARYSRKERKQMVDEIEKATLEHLESKDYSEDAISFAMRSVKKYIAKEVTKCILKKGQRLDGRALDEVRELGIEVDLLPRVHGSAMFMRGETQVLSVVTLGAPGDIQLIDTMEEDGKKRYMHHYNDAPYSYGEAGFMRGPGRRAIGHGALAERALLPVLPHEDIFPYTIRVVSEVLGSNGSSSMASTCASSLSLMAAGVPLKKPVAGIAMGLASVPTGEWKVITDLQDVEDGPGGMDFKVTGTKDGITAMQMDTKTLGLSWEIVKHTLEQSFKARQQILEQMNAIISTARAELSQYAPRIETILINPEKIGDLIGPAGKTIKKIVEETGAQIDIEQDGRVLITTSDSTAMELAKKRVNELTKDILPEEIYDGKVVRLEDFGAFVEILPGKDGLVHVSEIAWARIGKPSDVLTIGQIVKVKVKEIDKLGRVNLSIKALLPKPEGYIEPAGNNDGFRKSGGGFRPRGNGGFHKKD